MRVRINDLQEQSGQQYYLAAGRTFCQLAELLAEDLPVCYLSRESWDSAPPDELQFCWRWPSMEEKRMRS